MFEPMLASEALALAVLPFLAGEHDAGVEPARPDATTLAAQSAAFRAAALVVGAHGAGWEKGDFFSPFEARISVSFHSFRLIFGRELISRRVLEEWTLSLTHFIAKLTS